MSSNNQKNNSNKKGSNKGRNFNPNEVKETESKSKTEREQNNQIQKIRKEIKSEENDKENKVAKEMKDENEAEKKSSHSKYINSRDNIKKFIELKNDLKGENNYLDKYIQALDNLEWDNNDFECCYENGENMNKYLNRKLLEKNIFELQAKRIFSKVYELKEKILYPFFNVEYSMNKRANTIKIYYYKIEVKSDNNEPICFSFPIITDTFLVNFEEIPIIIEKKSDDNFLMSIISKDFNHSIDFHLL